MRRRRFCELSGCGAAGVLVLPVLNREEGREDQEQRRYDYSVEIVEAPVGGCGWGHKPGDSFRYPAEKGGICHWLMDSMNGFMRVLEYGGHMSWMYRGTPYEKVVDPDGVTTEFVRCPDPTTTVVAKIIRTRVED